MELKKEQFSNKEDKSYIGEFIVIFMDKLTNMFINLFNKLFQMASKQALTILKDDVVENKVYKHGTIYNYNTLRYFITVLVPPLGIFLSKGILGWVNILISILFCYINYFLGIGYGIIITYNSKYADLYDQKQTDLIKRIKYNLSKNEKAYLDENKGELIVMTMFMSVFVGLFILVIYFK